MLDDLSTWSYLSLMNVWLVSISRILLVALSISVLFSVTLAFLVSNRAIIRVCCFSIESSWAILATMKSVRSGATVFCELINIGAVGYSDILFSGKDSVQVKKDYSQRIPEQLQLE